MMMMLMMLLLSNVVDVDVDDDNHNDNDDESCTQNSTLKNSHSGNDHEEFLSTAIFHQTFLLMVV